MNRRLALGVIPAFLLVITIAPLAIFWGDLPEPMATHWGLSGTPDGSMPPFLLAIVMVVIFGGVWVATARATAKHPAENGSFVAVLWFIGSLLAIVTWMAVLANRDAAEWVDASEVTLLFALIAAAAATAMGALGWVLGGGRSSTIPEPAPAVPAPSGIALVWTGSAHSWPISLIGIGLIVTGAIVWGWNGLVLALIGPVLLLFSRVTVTTGPDGIVVTMGWFGLVTRRIGLDGIKHAAVEDVRPMAYGGWGYRVRPGARAVVVRGGESIRLVRDEVADLVLTVDGAATGAGSINAALGVDA
jgi:hypothetical protein